MVDVLSILLDTLYFDCWRIAHTRYPRISILFILDNTQYLIERYWCLMQLEVFFLGRAVPNEDPHGVAAVVSYHVNIPLIEEQRFPWYPLRPPITSTTTDDSGTSWIMFRFMQNNCARALSLQPTAWLSSSSSSSVCSLSPSNSSSSILLVSTAWPSKPVIFVVWWLHRYPCWRNDQHSCATVYPLSSGLPWRRSRGYEEGTDAEL